MSLALNDLLICCRQLEHDRATERRKEVEKFKRLIRDPETVQHLDRHSDSKQGKYLNWDAVFRFLQKYIQKETECLRTAKPNVSASTQTSRQKKMQEISSLVRYFIKCANKRAPRLKCHELLNYIMETVKDSSNGVIYGADCSNILLKDILSVRKYWCEISQQQWLELFSVYFRLYLKPSQEINRVLVARIIHAVTKGCCSQTDGLNSKFLDSFSKAVQYARQEKSSAGLGHILAALIIFLKSLAVNFRIQVCELGDEILPTLLYVWTQHRSNDSLKEVIIELFQLQIYIHHPKGAKTQEKGAYESIKWRSILYNLYELLVNEINQIGSRGKYSSGSRNIAVKENLIELMADVCHQVFNEDTRSLEISQSYTTSQRESRDYSTPCKRRKIELGWEVIKDYLQKSQNDFDLVPWLQITTQLISKYPASLPNCEISPLLMILYQLLPQQRHGERTPYVLRCLIEVALCQVKKSNLESSQKSDLVKLWIKIWSITLRGISTEQMQTENFGLLGAIIQGNLVEVDREFWKLFTGSACKPSGPSVCCLTLALTNSIVPETVKKGTEQNIYDVNRSFTLKESIMRWLLFYQLEDDLEDNTELPPILQSNFPHLILEKILVSLTMKNCKAVMNLFQSAPECEQHRKCKEEPSFSEVEQLFLQTTFDKMDFLTVVEECAVEKYQSSIGFSVHQNLKESLDRYLLGLSERLLNSYSSEITNSEILVRCSSLLVGVLGCYCYTGIVSEEEAHKSELFQKAKSLMQCAGESISLFKNKTSEESRIGTLRNMIHLCISCLHSFQLEYLYFSFLKASFIRKPLDYGEVDSMNDDIDENLQEVEDLSSMDLFKDYPVGSVSDASDSGESQSTVGAMNPLAEEYLSKQDLLLLDMLKFLCMCVTSSQANPVSFRAGDIRRKLLMLIDSSILDPTKSLHLHMYLVLLKELPGKEHPLPMEDVVELLKPLSSVCSLHRRDQDVCKTILNHVLPIVTNLSQGNMDTEHTRDAQGQFLRVIGAFWHLTKEKKCTFSVRMALVKCLKTLLEADPYSKWAILNVMGKDFSVNEVFPQFLADEHHQVRMLANLNMLTVLFLSTRFSNSSVFELFLVLEKVSETFGYRNLEDFMASHLDYLVLEWLNLQDTEYSLSSFPFILLNYTNVEDFYRSCYKVLIPHLVIRSCFDEVKSIANQIQEDWKSLLIDCFPKILVNILPYFAYEGVGDSGMAQQRENATKVYDILKGENLLGKQIDHLFISNLPEIVVELLMSLHETADSGASQSTDACDFSGDLDPAPNPPYFPSHVIKATFAYISNCHKTKFKSILEILSRNPDSYQKILLAICEQAAETNNVYKKHRVLKIYHLFVSLLLKDIKSGLGGAWAFVLRDVIYTLIHYINKRPSNFTDVSLRSFSLCCDLLGQVCQTAVTYCKDALEKHLHVIVGTLIPLVNDQVEVQEQVLNLLKYLVIDNKDNENLYLTIKLLDPFPDHILFKDLRITQQNIKYSRGPFSLLEEINHFLAVSDYDALPLTRLEGLKDLRRQLEQHKDQMMDLMRASQDNPQDGIVVKLVVSLLQLSKMAVNHTGEREVLEAVGSCLGEVGPIDFSTIAIQHSKDTSYTKALELFEDKELQWTLVVLIYLNNTLFELFFSIHIPLISSVYLIALARVSRTMLNRYSKRGCPCCGPVFGRNVSNFSPPRMMLALGLAQCRGMFLLSLLFLNQVPWEIFLGLRRDFFLSFLESEPFFRSSLDKKSQRTMLAVVDYMRRQKRPSAGTVFDDAFWLDLNYLEVAKVAQSCAAHFTALLYAEIYADKKNMNDQEKRSLIFEEGSQSTTISSLSEKSKEETGISLQDLLLEIYRSIGEPDSLYGCGGGKMLQPLTRLRTYEHEAMWEKALVTYDLETAISPVTRQAGIIQVYFFLGLVKMSLVQSPWDKGLEGTSYHESLYNALQSLKDREFSTFYESLKYARIKEVEELCKGSLESLTDRQISELYIKWRKHSQIIKDSDFSFQEPIMALRTVILEILMEKQVELSQRECFKDILTKHLIEFSVLARTFKNTQLPERAIFQIKQYNSSICGVSEWQLEEAQVFWAKKEQSLALNILKQMIKKLDANCTENDPNLKLIYTECLRVCGNWLAETCLENPAVIMQTYLEKAVEVAGSYDGESNEELRNGKMKAFLSLARFSDTQYQRIENYMKSSEFENKQALLKRAKEEVGLLREHKIQTNRYTVKVQRELELDECIAVFFFTDRTEAANKIICTIRSKRPQMIKNIEALCDAYIILANLDATQWKTQRKGISIPADQPITKLKNLEDVIVPTMEIKVDPTGEYGNLVTVQSFKTEFRLAGGLNLPKIIDCVGSDGKERRQLVKVRVPFGLYRPNDFSAFQCQKKMMEVQRRSFEEKYEIFMNICQNFQPVFRYFCMEKFLDPAVWFEKRLAYTRSVATSSIVGYILGLGDRHVQNILINEQSAELVHIDLGVAFEQGKILPTPETVPFRLTRDIVDGMGITGVEGVFRRCCEKTMEVMRNSQETLLTIVEVLLYDPLFDWTMNPLKALYLQQRPEDETELHTTPNADDRESKRDLSDIDQSFNKVAERVLMRLQEKLKGVEEGTVLSVGGQVNLLIQQAMDPKNLSRLFPGWKAWV
uniref:Serine-protein kinase ATM n=1 Tax=Ictidomys tridecemlineatus TaxID=43179 RepID=I3M4C5_ICTTR